jgi:tetratricopeptide (TPR) repeat protein
MNDVGGVLIGLWRRLTFGGSGVPRTTEIGERLAREADSVRYVRAHLLDLVRRHPQHAEPLIALGRAQIEDGELDAALETGAELRRRFGARVAGYQQGCTALRRLRRFDEAEALARAAMRRFPRSAAGFEAFAWCADERGDPVEGGRRWAVAARRFPGSTWAQLLHGRALGAAGHTEAADRVLRAAAEKWPRDASAWTVYADHAERCGDWRSAAGRWAAMRAHLPARPEGYARGARAWRQAGELEAAARLIREAVFLFPRDKAVHAEHAAVAATGADAGPPPEG